MNKTIRRYTYMALGAASITRKMAEQAVKSLTKEGAITAQQGKRLLVRLVDKASKQRKKLEKILIAEAQKEIKKMKKK